jgi:iron complex transport system ATP-binding protein
MNEASKKIALAGKNLSLGYTRQKEKKEILVALDFSLYSGELTCLLGPNGVGKSTLIKAILSQIKPWKGSIQLENQSISGFSVEELAKKIAVVLTDPVFPGNMTVGQLVALGRTPYTNWSGKLNDTDREVVEKALHDTNITYLRDERLSELSDGQRQKAMISRALAQDGHVMILDEPTAHLDLVNRFEIMSLLRELAYNQQKAILVVTHDLDIAIETADRFWLLNCGMPLISGKPEDLILSGQINQLLPGDKYRFNLSRGRIEMESNEFSLDIQGPSEVIFWLKKALAKAGVRELDSEISVSLNPLTIQYKGNSFGTMEDLVRFVCSSKNYFGSKN